VAGVGFVAVLASLVFAGAMLAHPLPVLQGEMRDTLQPGEYVLTDPVLPTLFGYGRGDVVMVRLGPSPTDLTAPYRVIGLPGDTIDLSGGHVLVNGHRLDEPYVSGGEPTDPESSGLAHWVVLPGSLFVLGDWRVQAADSRVYGPFPLAHVVGRAWVRCWPLGSLGFVSVP
jgi:signal peptidase I